MNFIRISFAEQCGQNSPQRQVEVQRILSLAQASGLEWTRLVWCDVHGSLRGKTWITSELASAFADGMGMVSTLMLKDTSDRTVYKVFEADVKNELPGFEGASNVMLLPDPATFKILPWAEKTGWLLCQPWFSKGQAVPYDSRRILQNALEKLSAKGWGMRCGLEVEFHIYKLKNAEHGDDADPDQASWPGRAPQVSMIHPGYNLLNELWFDRAEPALRIVKQTAQDLGLPLLSLEIELGPSQVEAVFKATDALTAADNMVLFRSAVKQALRRAGYHATFMCRPPFENIMSSGWHLHQSLFDLQSGQNLFARTSIADIQEAQRACSQQRTPHPLPNWHSVFSGTFDSCTGHDIFVHHHGQRLWPLQAQCPGTSVHFVGPRQSRRHAQSGWRRRRSCYAHRKQIG
jgi:glutamine synthetase